MDQDTMKNQTGIAKVFLYTFIIVGAVLIFTAPFWHIDFPKETKYIADLRKKSKEAEDVVTLEMDVLWSSYESGIVSAENYIHDNLRLNEQLKELKAGNSKLINTEIKNRKIFDWKTPRIFLIGLGVRLPYIIFSLIITLLIANRRDDPLKLRIAFTFLQVCCWSISVYLMIWVFWYSNDYSLSTYRYAFIAVSILIGSACAYYISNYETTVSGLKAKIRYVMSLMITKAVDKGHIKDEDKYQDEIIFPALKKLDE